MSHAPGNHTPHIDGSKAVWERHRDGTLVLSADAFSLRLCAAECANDQRRPALIWTAKRYTRVWKWRYSDQRVLS